MPTVIRQLFGIWLALVAALASAPAASQYSSDIDIYSDNPASADLPNVLLILDNSANWSSSIPVGDCYYRENGVVQDGQAGRPGPSGPNFSNPNKEQGTKMAIQKCALYNVIDALPTKADGSALFNIGFMLFNETPNDGGYPRKAFTPLTTANKAVLKTVIRNIARTGDNTSNSAFAKTMHEAYLYFKGDAPYLGTAGSKEDTTAIAGGRYVSPAASSCSRNFVILLANGGASSNNGDDAQSLLAGLGGNTTTIIYPSGTVDNKDQANYADEYARFMLGSDVSSQDGRQRIVTHGVAVTGASSDGNYPNYIRGIAKAGGGTFTEARDAESLTLTLLDIFNGIQAVNSVFASASLPVSVNARGTYLNQVYMGMFRPDDTAKPRWRGNVKQYKFGYDPATDSLKLVDTRNRDVISAATGFIDPAAVSVWTQTSTFWINQNPLLGTPGSGSDSPDGEVVEKGGIAQGIRTAHAANRAGRKIYTCVGCAAETVLSAATSTQFVTSNSVLTTSQFGVTTTAHLSSLIEWIRGSDNRGDESGPGGTVTVRPSVHGDVLHSRPAVVNFGTTTGVVVFYGANDGLLHAVDGNATGATAGQELWGFLPQELFGTMRRLQTNSPEIRLSSTPPSTTATSRNYYVDGPIGVYQKVNAAGVTERAIIYPAMRRGGRFIYALDVTTPTQPKFLWKRSNTDSGFGVLGQTWSEPKVARIKGRTNPVIIMGAGYDATAEDVTPPGATTMGNAVLVLDAFDGTLLKQFNTDRSVAADVALVDSDFDGRVDRVYATDVGGSIYRIDLETATSDAIANWSSYKIASLSTNADTRKFFYPPDVVQTSGFTALLAGSGDREKPLSQSGSDAFFTVYDTKVTKGTPGGTFTPFTMADLGRVGTGQSQTNGCYIPMSTGEKIVNAPTTVAGITYFSTNTPTPPSGQSCSANLGLAKVYSAPLFCKVAAVDELTGGGLPPSPVSGIVTVTYTDSSGNTVEKQVPFIIGAPNEKNSGIEGSKVTPTVTPTRKRKYWYLENAR